MLRAMPELAELAQLDADDIADAIGHRGKAERIATVVREVPAIGEDFLAKRRTPPRATRCSRFPASARSRRPRSCCAGSAATTSCLGARYRRGRRPRIYGRACDAAAIARRYGNTIGYLGVLPEDRRRPTR